MLAVFSIFLFSSVAVIGKIMDAKIPKIRKIRLPSKTVFINGHSTVLYGCNGLAGKINIFFDVAIDTEASRYQQ